MRYAKTQDEQSSAPHFGEVIKLRWLFAPCIFVAVAQTVANAQSTAPVTITTSPLILSFPSPVPASSATQGNPIALTTSGLVLMFPSPAPNSAPAVQPVFITTGGLVLTFPSPSPTPRK